MICFPFRKVKITVEALYR